MIVMVRGTSGSGKTTVMRKVIAGLPSLNPVWVGGRKNPLYYYDGFHSVLGSYGDSACGGADTIHGHEALFSLIRERAEVGHVLVEGLLLSEDVKWTSGLPRDTVRAIFLATPLPVCLERIKGRRMARGNDKPLNPENTSKRVATIERARARLENEGFDCRSATTDQAPRLILNWIRNG